MKKKLLILFVAIALIGVSLVLYTEIKSNDKAAIQPYSSLDEFINQSSGDKIGGLFKTESLSVVDDYWFIAVGKSKNIAVIKSGPIGVPTLVKNPFDLTVAQNLIDQSAPSSVIDKISELDGWSQDE